MLSVQQAPHGAASLGTHRKVAWMLPWLLQQRLTAPQGWHKPYPGQQQQGQGQWAPWDGGSAAAQVHLQVLGLLRIIQAMVSASPLALARRPLPVLLATGLLPCCIGTFQQAKVGTCFHPEHLLPQ